VQFLRRLVDKQRKLYAEPDSKLHKLWPLFDSMETFLFTPSTTAPRTGPHVRDHMDLKRTMMTVILALIPCFLWSIYNTGLQHFAAVASISGDGDYEYAVGWLQGLVFGSGYASEMATASFQGSFWDNVVFGLQQMLPIVFVSYFVGLNIEGVFAVIRKEEISEGYLVSGLLIALIVPPSIPLWQLAVGVAFSVVLVKEVFGGTGRNIFNVALMVRAFLFFAYPAQISGDSVWVAGNGPTDLVDGYSKATPLAVGSAAKIQEAHPEISAGQDGTVEVQSLVDGPAFLQDDNGVQYFETAGDAIREAGYSWGDMFLGTIPGSAGEMSALAVLLGAALLLITGVGAWRTMLSGCLGLVASALLMNLLASSLDGIGSVSVLDHFVMGGFLFGIVFMATDPVTCPETSKGKWIYGFLIGFVAVLVRAVNPAYPEGTMLAILLLNAFAPTIDHFVVAANIRRRKARLG
jgi:Na+-transporting NADH:ubiquinone oxidoreductase subunit B